ncbi:MAG: EVE domain-containing protein [Verrucomicrobia bacterium]|nr:EVE domain-containing protein [Verrucomicrobiota bacterium]
MGHWLVKQEPTTYSWSQFVADGKTDWTGIRNFQARNFLRSMKVGDQVFFYHSVNGKSVVGIAAVSREAFPDPTAVEGDWSAVELKPLRPVTPPVSLGQIKQDSQLRDIPLLKQSRLSVMPLSTEQFNRILQISAGS